MRWLLLLVLLTGCCKREECEGRLRLNLYVGPESLDPRHALLNDQRTIVTMLYDGLTRIGPDSKPHLALAQSIEQHSPTHYTVHLRPTRWTDNSPVTAHDFVRTWNQALAPDSNSTNAYQLYILQNAYAIKQGHPSSLGAQATDDLTLELHLAHPTPDLEGILASAAFFPVKGSLTNGPFSLHEWRPGRHLILNRNARYWEASSVHLSCVEMTIIENENTELYMALNDELDWAGSPFSVLPIDSLTTLRSDEKLHFTPAGGIYWYKINTTKPPLNNQKIRQALSLALDRSRIVSYVSQNAQQAATGIVPPELQTIKRRLITHHDPEKARSLFAAGLAELNLDESPPIVLSFNTNEDHIKFAQAVQHEWEQTLGLKVVLQANEWRSHLQKLQAGDFMIARHSWHANFEDEIDFLNPFRYQNETGWTHPLFSALLASADQETDPTTRANLLLQAEQLLIDQMPAIPLLFIQWNYIHNAHIEGATFSNLGLLDLKNVSIGASD